MPDTAARLALFARRYEVARFSIAVEGIDLTGVLMGMQVRLQRGTPGPALIQLNTVTTAAAEGLKLDSVTVIGGVPTSIIKGRINKSTMDDGAKVPFTGEVGENTVLAYAMQWTLGGDAQTRIEGDLVVSDSAYGSDNAPLNRPAGSSATGRAASAGGTATLSFGDQVIRVSIAGTDLLAPLAAAGAASANQAADSAAMSRKWAEGTLPNGAGTKSAREYAEAAASLFTPTSVKNLFDPAEAVAGTLNASTGAVGASSTFTTSGFIQVEPNRVYSRSGSATRVTAFYDRTLAFISSATGNTFKTPAGAVYKRVTFANAELPTAMAAAGNLAGPYVPFVSVREARDFRVTPSQVATGLRDAGLASATDRFRTVQQEDIVREVYNLFDNRRVIAGVRLSTAAVIAAAGNNISSLIPVQPSTLYTMNINSTNCAEYDADGVYIGPITATGGPPVYTFTTGANTAFIRLSVSDGSLATTMLVKGGNFPNGTVYVPYNLYYFSDAVRERRRKYEGKRIAWLGDSMSNPIHAASNAFALEMGFYNQPFRDNTDINPGYAISGRSLARRPTITGTDSQGNPYTQNSIVQMFNTVDANRDACFIYIGANDFGEPGGMTFGNMASRDDSSFYGALHLVCQMAIEKFPLKPVRFFTPTPRKRHLGGGVYAEQDQPNDIGKTLFHYADAMLEVCAFYSIPCLDQLRSSFLHPKSAVNFATYYPDGGGVHISADAHAKLAKRMVRWELGLGEV